LTPKPNGPPSGAFFHFRSTYHDFRSISILHLHIQHFVVHLTQETKQKQNVMKTKKNYNGSYEVTNNGINFTIYRDENAEGSHKWNYYIVQQDGFEAWAGSATTKRDCIMWIKREC
jgi:hypothetical protein